jgi:hypothetical protein
MAKLAHITRCGLPGIAPKYLRRPLSFIEHVLE